MDNARLNYLMERYAEGALTLSEWDEWAELMTLPEHEDVVRKFLMEQFRKTETSSSEITEPREIFERVFAQGNDGAGKVRRLHSGAWKLISVAAAIVIVLTMVAVYLRPARQVVPAPQISSASPKIKTEVVPGSDKAVLILSSGEKIDLYPNGKQTIADKGLSIQNDNGIVSYKKSDVVVYNTVATPKGGQYRLVLADGTSVWLNAESTITFPTSFTGNKRMVTMTGEVYFEVAKDASKPFTVKAGKEEITVLGTKFNVNTYGDESQIKTSLLEGSVREANKILKPGEAYVDGRVFQTNLEKDFAWKNGFFHFENASLHVVLQQISRWYNVEVVDNAASSLNERFYGKIQRSLNLQDVLFILEKSNVHFKLEGTKLIVLNNKPKG
jgi:hypothetical protein